MSENCNIFFTKLQAVQHSSSLSKTGREFGLDSELGEGTDT